MESTRSAAVLKNETRYMTGIPCPKGHIAPRKTKSGSCVKCAAETLKAWRAKNPDAVKRHNDTQYEAHSDKIRKTVKQYYEKNKEKVSKRIVTYKKNNPHIVAKTTAKRKAAMLNRTPAWLTDFDKLKINCIYALANMLTRHNNEQWVVDHNIPLQGKTVSGLHVPSNLRVIRSIDNRAKSNKYEVNP